ncbi:MAG: hypothetical protein WDZ30_02960 [Cellvibrionaceae bacterium]
MKLLNLPVGRLLQLFSSFVAKAVLPTIAQSIDVKAAKSKAQERREIEHQIEHFLQHGGKVHAVEQGISGRELGGYKLTPAIFQRPKEPRTPLVEEIRAIEARRIRRLAPAPKRKRPHRVLITDDFGEPLRWSWRDN